MTTSISSTIVLGQGSSSPLTLHRMGYGTMRLTGEGIWGEPADRNGALQVLKKALEAGVRYFDTADYYGPGVTNRLIAEALHPYPNDLVIGTKVGAIRGDNKSWLPFNKPDQLRQSIDNNLKELKQEHITLVHFRAMDHGTTPFEESMQAMFDMQREGKILHVGVSNVSREQLQTAMAMGIVASVQNLYSYAQRTTLPGPYGGQGGEQVLDICEAEHIPLIPYFSLQTSLGKTGEKMEQVAAKYSISVAQLNLAWLLHKSPWILPIPGTTSLKHLEENLAAMQVSLSDEDMALLG